MERENELGRKVSCCDHPHQKLPNQAPPFFTICELSKDRSNTLRRKSLSSPHQSSREAVRLNHEVDVDNISATSVSMIPSKVKPEDSMSPLALSVQIPEEIVENTFGTRCSPNPPETMTRA